MKKCPKRTLRKILNQNLYEKNVPNGLLEKFSTKISMKKCPKRTQRKILNQNLYEKNVLNGLLEKFYIINIDGLLKNGL